MEKKTDYQKMTDIFIELSIGSPWGEIRNVHPLPMKSRIIRVLISVFLLVWIAGSVAAVERMAVVVPKANVRSGPGTEHEIRWSVAKYFPMNIIKKTDSWYLFKDFDGDTGWIHKSLLGSVSTVITSADKSNVRSGPGTNFEIVLTAERGVCFLVKGKQGDWTQIEHEDGYKGWIHNSLIW